MILNCPRTLVASLTIESGCLIVKGVCVRRSYMIYETKNEIVHKCGIKLCFSMVEEF